MSTRPGLALCWTALLVCVMSCDRTFPTAPSPTFAVAGPDSVSELICPADIALTVNHRRPVRVTFEGPSFPGLAQVSKSSCTPASGSRFSTGTTPVTCTATWADVARSCTLSVTVVSQTLSRTSFLAFGDSITTGIASPDLFPGARSGLPTSYPAQMEAMLRQRYPDQRFTVVNAGLPGEKAHEGLRRAPEVLDAHRPEVLLLLEGINQLTYLTPARVAEDLDAIVQVAQQRGTEVLLATLTPIGPVKEHRRPGTQAAILELNRRIVGIARARNLGPVVDLFQAMSRRSHLLGDDGLHPTAEGYRVMAGEFMRAILSRHEIILGNDDLPVKAVATAPRAADVIGGNPAPAGS